MLIPQSSGNIWKTQTRTEKSAPVVRCCCLIMCMLWRNSGLHQTLWNFTFRTVLAFIFSLNTLKICPASAWSPFIRFLRFQPFEPTTMIQNINFLLSYLSRFGMLTCTTAMLTVIATIKQSTKRCLEDNLLSSTFIESPEISVCVGVSVTCYAWIE